jgi:multiple sugar transport system permease protein
VTNKTGRNRAALAYLALVAWSIVTLFPIVWVYFTSFKTRVDAFALPPRWLFAPTLENYDKALHAVPFFAYLGNSLLVTVGSTLLSLLLGTMSAYALTRYVFAGRRLLGTSLLATRVLPGAVTVVPLFMLFTRIHALDNYAALTLTYTAYNLPLATFLLIAYIEQVSPELEASAMVDGCSRAGAFMRVTLPLLRPGLAVTAVFSVLAAWNEFLFALTFMYRNLTLPVAVAMTMTDAGVDWGQATALAGLILIPIIGFTLLMSRQLVEGLTLGAVKG